MRNVGEPLARWGCTVDLAVGKHSNHMFCFQFIKKLWKFLFSLVNEVATWGQAQCLIPVIPSTWEMAIRKIMV
jgi:hypothetical protein